MNICLFSAEEISLPLPLHDRRAEHILKVLHKKEGDEFSAGIIGGESGIAKITKIEAQEESSPDGKKHFTSGTLSFTFTPTGNGKPLYPLVMVIGFPRPIQLKRLLRDMAGLGVSEVHLVGTERGEKSYLKSDLATTQSGEQMLLEGTEQAASTYVPLLKKHRSLTECVSFLDGRFKERNLIALDNIRPHGSLGAWLRERNLSEKTIVAAVGSERGWSENERSFLEQNGFVRLGMGSRVLRTETAATVSASIILDSMGFLS